LWCESCHEQVTAADLVGVRLVSEELAQLHPSVQTASVAVASSILPDWGCHLDLATYVEPLRRVVCLAAFLRVRTRPKQLPNLISPFPGKENFSYQVDAMVYFSNGCTNHYSLVTARM
jgi:hypothetical protein